MGRSEAVLFGEQTPPISSQILAFQWHFVCEAMACLGGQPGGGGAGVSGAWSRTGVTPPACRASGTHAKGWMGPRLIQNLSPCWQSWLSWCDSRLVPVLFVSQCTGAHGQPCWVTSTNAANNLYNGVTPILGLMDQGKGSWELARGPRQLFLSPSPPSRGGKGPHRRPCPVPLTPVWLPGHPGGPVPGTSPAPGTVPRGHSGPGALLQTSLPPRARYPRRPPPLPRAPALLTAGKVGAVSLRRPSADLPVTLEKPSERLSHCAAPGFPGN